MSDYLTFSQARSKMNGNFRYDFPPRFSQQQGQFSYLERLKRRPKMLQENNTSHDVTHTENVKCSAVKRRPCEEVSKHTLEKEDTKNSSLSADNQTVSSLIKQKQKVGFRSPVEPKPNCAKNLLKRSCTDDDDDNRDKRNNYYGAISKNQKRNCEYFPSKLNHSPDDASKPAHSRVIKGTRFFFPSKKVSMHSEKDSKEERHQGYIENPNTLSSTNACSSEDDHSKPISPGELSVNLDSIPLSQEMNDDSSLALDIEAILKDVLLESSGKCSNFFANSVNHGNLEKAENQTSEKECYNQSSTNLSNSKLGKKKKPFVTGADRRNFIDPTCNETHSRYKERSNVCVKTDVKLGVSKKPLEYGSVLKHTNSNHKVQDTVKNTGNQNNKYANTSAEVQNKYTRVTNKNTFYRIKPTIRNQRWAHFCESPLGGIPSLPTIVEETDVEEEQHGSNSSHILDINSLLNDNANKYRGIYPPLLFESHAAYMDIYNGGFLDPFILNCLLLCFLLKEIEQRDCEFSSLSMGYFKQDQGTSCRGELGAFPKTKLNDLFHCSKLCNAEKYTSNPIPDYDPTFLNDQFQTLLLQLGNHSLKSETEVLSHSNDSASSGSDTHERCPHTFRPLPCENAYNHHLKYPTSSTSMHPFHHSAYVRPQGQNNLAAEYGMHPQHPVCKSPCTTPSVLAQSTVTNVGTHGGRLRNTTNQENVFLKDHLPCYADSPYCNPNCSQSGGLLCSANGEYPLLPTTVHPTYTSYGPASCPKHGETKVTLKLKCKVQEKKTDTIITRSAMPTEIRNSSESAGNGGLSFAVDKYHTSSQNNFHSSGLKSAAKDDIYFSMRDNISTLGKNYANAKYRQQLCGAASANEVTLSGDISEDRPVSCRTSNVLISDSVRSPKNESRLSQLAKDMYFEAFTEESRISGNGNGFASDYTRN